MSPTDTILGLLRAVRDGDASAALPLSVPPGWTLPSPVPVPAT